MLTRKDAQVMGHVSHAAVLAAAIQVGLAKPATAQPAKSNAF